MFNFIDILYQAFEEIIKRICFVSVQQIVYLSIIQWFLTMLKLLNPASSIHACIHRTLRCSWKNKMCVMNLIYFILIILFISPNPWGSIEPTLRTTDLSTVETYSRNLLAQASSAYLRDEKKTHELGLVKENIGVI